MSLHTAPVTAAVVLPDGRTAEIRVGIAEDGYVDERLIDTVSLEVRAGHEVLAVLNTVLDAEDEHGAQELVREVAVRLASGDLEPTASQLEPLADTLRKD